jgi:multimeric flavodoxin WrbA
MNILILQASPKKDGNTATLVERFKAGIAENGGHEITEFWLNWMKIQPCQACFKCRGKARCVVQDDMQQIYPAMEVADLVVFAMPIYWWNMNAQMKLCIDRLTALLSQDDSVPALRGKQVVLVVAYNFADCAAATIRMFEDFKGWLGVKLDVLQYCSKEAHVSSNAAKLEEAYALGKVLGTAG